MSHGGKRPGAGRKKGTVSSKKKIEMLTLKEKLAPYMDEVVEAMREKWLAGDTAMIKEYWERTIGKVPQSNEVQGEIKIIVEKIHANDKAKVAE